MTDRQTAVRDLMRVPGVGVKTASLLWDMGIKGVSDLDHEDPEGLYLRACVLRGETIDRCVLYVFRAAVYYASNDRHEERLLKWWNWQDAPGARVKAGEKAPKARRHG
jgi:hypothetical protein